MFNLFCPEMHDLLTHLDPGGIRTIPPGFIRGLDFDDAAVGCEIETEECADSTPVPVEPIYVPSNKLKRTGHREDSSLTPAQSAAAQVDEEVEALLPSGVSTSLMSLHHRTYSN